MKTHDFTGNRRTFGHDYTVTEIVNGGMIILVSGWGHGIQASDFILLENGESSTRYKVDTISYYSEPPDMWKATLSFDPRNHDKVMYL